MGAAAWCCSSMGFFLSSRGRESGEEQALECGRGRGIPVVSFLHGKTSPPSSPPLPIPHRKEREQEWRGQATPPTCIPPPPLPDWGRGSKEIWPRSAFPPVPPSSLSVCSSTKPEVGKRRKRTNLCRGLVLPFLPEVLLFFPSILEVNESLPDNTERSKRTPTGGMALPFSSFLSLL